MGAIKPFLRQPRLAGMCLAALTFLVFWPLSNCGYISFDDSDYVAQNPRVLSGLTAGNAGWAFTTFHAQNWHPLTWLSLMADAEVVGPDPAALHLVSLLWHVANAVLVFVVLRKLTGDFGPPVFVAALFALHPLHVESVTWISERKDVLSTFFLLLTLLAYARYARTEVNPKTGSGPALPRGNPHNWGRGGTRPYRFGIGNGEGNRAYALALGLFALGLMSKPMLVTTPFVLLLLDYWPLRRFGRVPFARLLLEKLPFFILSVASSVVTFLAQQHGGAVRTLEYFPLASRLGNAVVSYGAYLQKTIWPAGLSIFYPHPGQWPMPVILLSTALILVLSAVAFGLRKRAPYVLVGWCWFLGTLVPVIGLVQVGIQAMADRYTYVPLVGVFIAVAWGAADLLARRPRLAAVVTVLAVSIVIACAFTTRRQLSFWRNDETLFGHAVAVNPENPLAQNNLADALLRGGRPGEAISHYREVIRLNPAYAHAYNNLGAALVATGKPGEALPLFERAVQLSSAFSEAHLNLGDALAAAGRYPEALAQYQAVLQRDSNSVPALVKMARLEAQGGNTAQAVALCRQALAANSKIPMLHIELGKLLLAQGKVAEGLAEHGEAVRLNPDDAEGHFAFGQALAAQGKRAEAAGQFKETLRINPGHPAAAEQLRTLAP